ncbi:FecR family protein [Gaoshiqia sediminis]|uniref:DUF4974 domain-containing protein n=1 Tax=Gaoshiqia sediminis TaxID=2986998 RepID=A0AA41Y464_9BACT|nr:FecR domain-containing protein [Gaoshiqia sediminis]MCW0483119.1 DUF4974 domain-containing protein [Gaoshiqia sediminis]
MVNHKKLDQLLADENFQDDLRAALKDPQRMKVQFIQKYSIREEEFQYAQRILGTLSFQRAEIDHKQIDKSFNRVLEQIERPRILANKKTTVSLWFTRIAAVLTLPLLLTTFYFYQQTRILQFPAQPASGLVAQHTFHAPLGIKTQVVLPDGSLVWLNSGSSLTFPVVFQPNQREIQLQGEAYFEVVKNPAAPMLVSTEHMKIKVYGTKFNVNAFADDQIVRTTLVEGKVTLIPENNTKEYALSPGYTALYYSETKEIKASEVTNMTAYTGWKDGKLLLQDENFGDILKKLERWYNVEIQLSDPSLADYTLYATFVDESIEQVLSIISNSLPIQVEFPKRIRQADGSYAKRKIMIHRNWTKSIS